MSSARAITVAASFVVLLGGCAVLSGAPDGLRAIGAGLTAHGVCSGAFVAGRPWRTVLADDIVPASVLLRLVDVSVDETAGRSTATLAGATRSARWLPDRGCVLDAETVSPTSIAPMTPPATPTRSERPWPLGDAPIDPAEWGASVDADALRRVVDAAFVGAGDATAANARGVAIVHRGRLLVERGAPGFAPGTPLHGWSMTKTVVAMLAHRLASDGRLDVSAPVVEAFTADRAPQWRDAWRTDARARIRVDDLVRMRDGLANDEGYSAVGSVVRMLYGTGDVAGRAAIAPAQADPGARWRYLSASANLLSRVLRGRVASDAEHWAMPRRLLFEPIGARTALIETDADGTWIGSSFMWASAGDWARLGELTLRDGRWGERQVLAPGWLAHVSRPSMPDGPGRAYGASVWRIGDASAGPCRGRVPDDTIAMSGHGGQLVAIVPSREAIVVRLGWTIERGRFDDCSFVESVLAALR